MTNYTILIPIVVYFIVLITYNLSNRYRDYQKTKNQNVDVVKNYSVSDRNLGALALAMTSASTYASASSFIGGPGTAYYYGLGWILIALIQVPTMWFVFSVIGGKINLFANKYNCKTVNEILLARYNSKLLVNLTSLILVVCFIASITVQFIGAARLLQGAVNIDYRTALFMFAIVISIYTVFGNFKTVAYSDVFQGFVMIIGSILLLAFTLYYIGGIDVALNTIKQRDANLFDPYNKIISPELYFSFWVLVCFGVLGLPQTVLRTMATQSAKQRLKAIVIATITLFVIMTCMHLSGFFANAVLTPGQISSPDLVVPNLITQVMSPVLAAIFLIAPMAAIISTIDSMLIQSTSTIVNDLALNNFKPINSQNDIVNAKVQTKEPNKQLKVKVAIRITTLVLIVCAVIFSINPPNILIWLNILSFGGLQATFLWPIVLGLFTNWVNKFGALASVIVGVGTYAFLTFSGFKILGLHQIVPALIFSLIALLIVNTLVRSKN
ncbi:sodium/pantothenate symporter [Psittacicella hinzii]|uniref:Sodium/panthothenate symporter n=1 Tax=Psittacicella hinzii TaxID=2028575 RepID=A0A3A1YEV3_9GAMM|nr:sodium/pantothenate symporter [Psittacicella hinzii]RIY34744.1 sodium/panthothenate symporter [Psittacicella hinzii]